MNNEDIININNYLNLLYKYKNFIASVEEDIVEELNNEYKKQIGTTMDMFSLKKKPFTPSNEYPISNIFLGKYIIFNKDQQDCCYFGINPNTVECFGSDFAEKTQKCKEKYEKCFLGVDIEGTYLKEYNNNFVEDDDNWYDTRLNPKCLNSPNTFVKEVVRIVINNFRYFPNSI